MALGITISKNYTANSSNKFELILSSYSGSIKKNQAITITVTTPSDGRLFVFSSDTSIAQASITDNTITITGINYGQAIITVSQEAGTNYNAPDNKTFLCIVESALIPGSTLDDTSWEIISEISRAGDGALYWNVGDTKSITLNGKIGTLSLSNFACKVFILHFNYPMNEVADNNIIWGGFKSKAGNNIALVDSDYNSNRTSGVLYFNMNHWGHTNYGGWKGSDLRYDILGATSTAPSEYGSTYKTSRIGYDATTDILINPKANTLLAALPSDLRSVLRLWSRWIDAVGNSSNIDANIKETVDAVTLLTEFEVLGTRKKANQYEKNYQQQMEFYRLSNNASKYKYNDLSTAVWYWLSSPSSEDSNYFCGTDGAQGGTALYYSSYSGGIAPAFKT